MYKDVEEYVGRFWIHQENQYSNRKEILLDSDLSQSQKQKVACDEFATPQNREDLQRLLCMVIYLSFHICWV